MADKRIYVERSEVGKLSEEIGAIKAMPIRIENAGINAICEAGKDTNDTIIGLFQQTSISDAFCKALGMDKKELDQMKTESIQVAMALAKRQNKQLKNELGL